ncbi:hypothetical protein G6F42_018932 [Rhizopus arrhizus]|nr:hypothetical protein G6F42_018932 [Rhizopus arrhizus]
MHIMRFAFVFIGLSTLAVLANGQQQQDNTAQPNEIVSDQEVLFPASMLNNAQLQSIEAQLQQPVSPIPTIPQDAEDKDTGDLDQSDDNDEDDEGDGEYDDDDEEDDDEAEEEADWVNAADESLTKDLVQKQNHILTTSWSVSGSSSYPIVIDTDFVFNPITLAPESSRTGATTTATATPAVRNKKKVRPASSANSSNILTTWLMAVPFSLLSANYLFSLHV